MELRADNCGFTVGGRKIFDSLALVCSPGTLTALVGPSGCGKTTLLHCLGLLQRPTAGAILVDGVSTSRWTERRKRAFWSDACSFVLQDYGLMDEESVASNVAMRTGLFRGRAVIDAQRLARVLSQVGLDGRESDSVMCLSGGEKQRLAIARSLYKDARIVLVDEPTASLDVDNRNLVVSILDGLRRQGRTVVVATHDEALTSRVDLVVPVGPSADVGGSSSTRAGGEIALVAAPDTGWGRQ